MRRLLRGMGANVVALGTASFFTDFAAEMVFPLLPSLVVVTLGAAPWVLGLIEGGADALSSLLRIPSGWLSDRVRKRKLFILVGYGISAAARPIYAAVTAAWHVLAIRYLDRLGKGLRLASRDALIADSCEPEVRGKAFGFQRAMDHLGAALGPLVAALLLSFKVPLPTVFLLTAIPAFLVLAVIAAAVRDVPVRTAPPPLRLGLRPFGPTFKLFLLAVVVFMLGNSSDAFILLRAADSGIPPAFVPLLWTGLSLIRMLGSVPAGILADRWSRRGVVFLGWLVFAAAYAGLAFATTPLPFVLLVAFYGLYHPLGESVLRALVADFAPAQMRATAYGMFHFTVGLAALPASLGFGLLYKAVSPASAFLTSAGLAFMAALLLLRLPRGKVGV